MVPDLSSIVEHLARLGLDELFKRLLCERSVSDETIELGDVALVVLAVVEFEGLLADVRSKSVLLVGEGFQLESHLCCMCLRL